MAIGLSGLISGLDTDSIVKAMTEAQSTKKTKIQNKITLNKWTTEAWSEMNKKIYKFYTEQASKLRLKSTYQTRSATSSDDNKVKATASQNAAIGSHKLQIKSLASSQFVTGAKLDKAYTQESKMSAISGNLVGEKIKITNKVGSDDEKVTEIKVTEDMTIKDFIKECKNAGVTASYDVSQQRFFFSSGDSGSQNAFTITSEGYNSGYRAAKAAVLDKMPSDVYDALSDEDKKTYNDAIDIIMKADKGDVDTVLSGTYDPDDTNNTEEQIALYSAIVGAEALMRTAGETNQAQLDREAAFQTAIQNFYTFDDTNSYGSGDLSKLGLGVNGIDGSDVAETTQGSLVVIGAKDAQIVLDGATMSSASNSIVVNGLTMNLEDTTYNAATGDYDTISVNVEKNTENTYKVVKEAITAYNELIDELNTLYNAKSARGYDPLTSEQKEAMTEEEIENWETKIKSALFRRDSTVGSLLSGMRNALNTTVKAEDGTETALSTYGIVTGTYTEYGKLHIYGDTEDGTYATYQDRLKSALDEDPDKVMDTLSGVFSNLYDTLSEKCAKTNLSSALTFYNDKMYSDYLTSYEKDLSNMEEKINDLTDKYYKQFTAMEKAMSEMQSKSNALAGMLGQTS